MSLRKVIMPLFLATTLFLTACQVSSTTPSTSEASSKAVIQETQSSDNSTTADTSTEVSNDTALKVDRYDSIFDPSSISSNLNMWSFKIESGTDTKSGDSTFLISPDGKTMLIDAGAPECAPQIIDYLKSLNITRIDYLVASHPHIDHIGGMVQLMDAFEIGAVYMSHLEYPTNTYKQYMTTINEKNLDIVYLSEGMDFSFGDSITIEVFNPTANIAYYDKYPEGSTQFVNNHSVVLKLIYNDTSILFAGDLYAPQELELTKKYGDALNATILKVPHHGADTSSTSTFLKTVKPEIGIMINDGIDSLPIYNKYKKLGCNTFITFIDGCIRLTSDGTTVSIMTQFDRLPNSL